MIDADSLRDHITAMWDDFDGSQLAQVNLLWWWHLDGKWVLSVPRGELGPQPNTGPTRIPEGIDGVGRFMLCSITLAGTEGYAPDGLVGLIVAGGYDDVGAATITCGMWNPLSLEWHPTANEGDTVTALRMRQMLTFAAGASAPDVIELDTPPTQGETPP